MHRTKAAKKPAKIPWVPAGEISHYFPKVKAAVFKCRVPLAIGDAIWVKGKNTDFKQTVGSMQIDRKPIERASKGQEIGLEVFQDVRVGDQVFLTRI
ncbi:MAG: translation elongation factor-like protein [Candidatus Omnitrophica bacterium]|nr:translation elongation factor-like protein [Candidatus Omnitrophota bacterium]